MSFHTNPRLLAFVPTAVFAGLTAIIAFVPALQMNARYRPTDETRVPSAAAMRGRQVYISFGCSYCHTQQVRSDTRLPADAAGRFPVLAQDARYGRASRPEDYVSDDPPLLGSERVGPDLSNVWDRMPNDDWHYAHLYDPRILVPASIMAPYPFLFTTRTTHGQRDRKVVIPDSLREKLESDPAKRSSTEVWATPRAQDLIEYLKTLKPESRAP